MKKIASRALILLFVFLISNTAFAVVALGTQNKHLRYSILFPEFGVTYSPEGGSATFNINVLPLQFNYFFVPDSLIWLTTNLTIYGARGVPTQIYSYGLELSYAYFFHSKASSRLMNGPFIAPYLGYRHYNELTGIASNNLLSYADRVRFGLRIGYGFMRNSGYFGSVAYVYGNWRDYNSAFDRSRSGGGVDFKIGYMF